MVRKSAQSAQIKRRLQVMMKERMGEPELPLGDDFDPETGEVLTPEAGS
jgi:hypothetical protein